GDVVIVHRRQGTWIYGTKVKRRDGSGGEVEAASVTEAASPTSPTAKPDVGWIPVAFVAKYSVY
ncbi:hypothetical protein HDU67_008873, partial [Dinochytrium kinnereticum]